jgi:hypothetical protein
MESKFFSLSLTPVGLGIVLSPLFWHLAFLSAGFGHGNYSLAVALFPIPMLAAVLGKEIGLVAIYLAGIQFPAYGFSVSAASRPHKKRVALILLALHIIALVIVVALDRTGQFLHKRW